MTDEEIIERLRSISTQEKLSQVVFDIKWLEARQINEMGTENQLQFIYNHGGTSLLKKVLFILQKRLE